MAKKSKTNQIKSEWYYFFWAIMAASVVIGQLYVGTGYREMNNTIEEFIQYSVWKDKNRQYL